MAGQRIGVSAYPASCVVDMWRTVPLSTRIAARERGLRFGRVGRRTGKGQDQRMFHSIRAEGRDLVEQPLNFSKVG